MVVGDYKLKRQVALAAVVVASAFSLSCDGAKDARALGQAQARLRVTHDKVAQLLKGDVGAHRTAIAEVAKRLAPGFAVADPATRETQMRAALKWMRHVKKGVPGLIASPASFIAAVGGDGRVIARDKVPDAMRGKDFAARFDVVARALAGREAAGEGEFFAKDKTQPSSVSLLFAAPVHSIAPAEDADLPDVVGAVITGVPLTRWAQRVERQLKIDAIGKNQAFSTWVFLVHDDRLFHMGDKPDIAVLAQQVLDKPANAHSLDAKPTPIWAHGRNFLPARAKIPLQVIDLDVILLTPADP